LSEPQITQITQISRIGLSRLPELVSGSPEGMLKQVQQDGKSRFRQKEKQKKHRPLICATNKECYNKNYITQKTKKNNHTNITKKNEIILNFEFLIFN